MPPFNPQRRRALAPDDKLGTWQDGTFKFDSPEAEQRWAVEAYRSGVHATDWHRGTPLDDKTRDVVLSGLGGPTAPVFRGPDGQYRFANINTIEPADIRAHRVEALRGKRMADLTGREMPGEDVIAARYAKKAASTPPPANENTAPVPAPAKDNPPQSAGLGRFAAMAQAQKQADHPSLQETLQHIDDGVRLFASGATLGYADNVAAAGNALFGNGTFAEDYDKNLAAEIARTEAARQRSGTLGAIIEAAPGMIPIYGDTLSLIGDAKQYIEHPETATIGNILGTVVTALPVTPNVLGAARKVENAVEGTARTKAKVAKADDFSIQAIDPHETRFSQATVSYEKRRNGGSNRYTYDDIANSMKQNGWKGDAIDVVRMPDGKLTTADNTRILAARDADIKAQARVRDFVPRSAPRTPADSSTINPAIRPHGARPRCDVSMTSPVISGRRRLMGRARTRNLGIQNWPRGKF